MTSMLNSTSPSVGHCSASQVTVPQVASAYELPWPNGNKGVGSMFETSLRRPNGGLRYVDGWEPVSRGMPTGRCPDGLTVPSRTSAMACPPSWPGKKVCTMAPALSAKAVSYTHLRAHETGRNLVCRLL